MYNDFDWYNYEVDKIYQPKNKPMLNHNWKMVLGLFIMFVVGGLGALHDVGPWGAYVDMIVPILLGAEHLLNGRIS